MTAQVIVGLDAGTSGVKAAAFDVGSPWQHVAVRDLALGRPAPGRFEQDPDEIVRAAGAALAECVAAAAGAEVVGLSVSAGMHGLLALDDDRRPLTPLVTWADARARDEARGLRESGQAGELHARTGVPVHPMSPLTKLLWFARHEPELWRAARWWVGLKEVLLAWLTGNVVTELSSASGTGLLDMATRAWSPAVLDLAGVPADRLAPVGATSATFPLAAEAAAVTGLPAGTPVVAGAGDGPLANLGAGALAPGVAGLSLGTSGAVRAAVDGPCVDDEGTLFCYALTDDVWVVGGAISNGGSIVRWLADALGPEAGDAGDPRDADSTDAVLELASGAPPGSDGLVMLPYVLPERAPLWDPDLPGTYLGLRHGHTRAHLARAAVEGVCRQLRTIVDALDRLAPVATVRATGGALRSDLWRDVLAATIGRPLHVEQASGGTARGAAALGLWALGRADSLAAAAALLGVTGTPPAPPVAVDPRAAAVYDGVPDRIGRMVAQLARAAAAADPT